MAEITLTKAQLVPLGDRVLVRLIEEKEEARSGLIIPDSAKEKPQRGVVLSAGPGRISEEGGKLPMEVKKGDKVLYSKYSGNEIKIDGQECLIVRQEDILGILR